MHYLNRDQVDTKKWNAVISASHLENIFCYSWYLDSVSQNWGALVYEDYQTILPIPFTKKFGIKRVYQPPFTRELDIFGNDFSWVDVLAFLSDNFKAAHFRNNSEALTAPKEKRNHQLLELNSVNLKYSTNAKRLIKKSAGLFEFRKGEGPEKLVELFKETAFKKIDSISKNDLVNLIKLMKSSVAKDHGELIEVFEKNNFVAAGFFLKDKKRITYLKGSAKEEAKKNGAMYGLMDFAIKGYYDDYNTFDFGGSDIENVASFNKKFGATDRTYYNYSVNNLPAWFKALKRIKG